MAPRRQPSPVREPSERALEVGFESQSEAGLLSFVAERRFEDLFVVPEYMVNRRPGAQPLGMRRLTSLRMMVIPEGMTDGVALINRGQIAAIEPGREPALVLVFDAGEKNRSLNLRPHLPLTLQY